MGVVRSIGKWALRGCLLAIGLSLAAWGSIRLSRAYLAAGTAATVRIHRRAGALHRSHPCATD